MDSLRLRSTDAELIKNRLTSLSRRTIWSQRKLVVLLLLLEREEAQERREENGEWSRNRPKNGDERREVGGKEEGRREACHWKK